ncbi:MAG: Gfo/Idh/MocA family oxidoreductase [Syntrophales bacterium]|nr:Gfo/Idh/MocA family oxidoreductase [Syntrophales bacterium]
MDRVRIGVVGVGHLGTYHLQKYEKLSDCHIVGVVDIIPERAETAAQRFKCKPYIDYRELLGQVDAVSIAVPTVSHYFIARDFLCAGVDVLVEKPITTTLEEADELIDIAEKSGKVLQVGFVERFNPAVVALRSVIEKPLFIEAHRLHPFFERGTDVDVILDLMIHDLDIILHFSKSPVTKVEAVGIPVLSDKVDIANVRLTFEDGCVANITASRVTGKTLQKIRFFGPEGYHSVDYAKRELVSLGRIKDKDGKWLIKNLTPDIPKHDPLEEEIKSFVSCVKNRRPPQVSGYDGRRSLALALEIISQMKTVPPQPE